MRKHRLLAFGTITLLLILAIIGLAFTDSPTAYSSELPAQRAHLLHLSTSNAAISRHRRALALARHRRTSARHRRAIVVARHRRALRLARLAAITRRERRAAAIRLHRLTLAHPIPAGGVWQALRDCESGGNYQENSGNGYYGAYQFDLTTWHSIGYGGLPSQAPFYIQDQAAKRLEAQRGWQPWPVCSIRLNL